MKKKWIAVFASMFVIASSVSSFGAAFADMDNLPWAGAEEYIEKAAQNNLISGEVNASGQSIFRGKDNVTYCETVQMAYNLLNKAGKISGESVLSKWNSVLEGYHIPEWAREAVSYFLEQAYISIADVSKFMNSATESKNATREDAAMIFGKALSVDYTLDASAQLTFNDKNSISSASTPYIELLVRLDIITGDTSNNFRPANNINRAEMAVILTKAYDELQQTSTDTGSSSQIMTLEEYARLYNENSSSIEEEEKGYVKGDVTYLTKSKIKIDGVTYSIDEDDISIRVYNENTGSYVTTLSKLIKAYEDDYEIEAKAYYDSSDYVTEITGNILDDDDDDDYAEGEITSLSTSKLKIDGSTYIIDDEDDIDIDVEDGTEKISITDFDDLMDAIDDDKVIEATVYFDSDDVVIKIKGEVIEVTGELRNVDTRDETIELTTDSGNYTYAYEDEDDVTIRLDGSSIDMDELEAAMEEDDIEITIYLEDGYIEKIVAEYL